MGNFSSAIYADVEDFKAIVSSPESTETAQNTLENTALINNIGNKEQSDSVQESDLLTVKYINSTPVQSQNISTKPKVLPHGPVTIERLKVELQDMREELEQLKSQHKKEIKLLMNELDEEKKIRLSLQVEVEHLKKHMSK